MLALLFSVSVSVAAGTRLLGLSPGNDAPAEQSCLRALRASIIELDWNPAPVGGRLYWIYLILLLRGFFFFFLVGGCRGVLGGVGGAAFLSWW